MVDVQGCARVCKDGKGSARMRNDKQGFTRMYKDVQGWERMRYLAAAFVMSRIGGQIDLEERLS